VFGKGRHHVTSASVRIVREDFKVEGFMEGAFCEETAAGNSFSKLATM
jgi:hypothetical protein